MYCCQSLPTFNVKLKSDAKDIPSLTPSKVIIESKAATPPATANI